MTAAVAALKAARESRPGGRINLQESQSTTAATRQIRLLHASKNLQQVRGLGVLHGRRNSSLQPALRQRPAGNGQGLSRKILRFEPGASGWFRWRCYTDLA